MLSSSTPDKFNRDGKAKNKDLKRENIVKRSRVAGPKGTHREVPIDLIMDNPDQSRSFMNEERLVALEKSIATEGLHHPLVVYQDRESNKFILKAGHRRLSAIKRIREKNAKAGNRVLFDSVLCEVVDNIFFATLAAVSTNHEAEAIHPIDKGVDINAVLRETNKDKMRRAKPLEEVELFGVADLADHFGVAESTIRDWQTYAVIDTQIREYLVKEDIRTKEVLRMAVKISKSHFEENSSDTLSDMRFSEFFHWYEEIFLAERKRSGDPASLKPKIKSDSGLPKTIVLASLDTEKDEFTARKGWQKLSQERREDLARELRVLANEIEVWGT